MKTLWLLINCGSFILFAVDKMLAVKGIRRISEKALILSAVCFGAVGVLTGMLLFHHKTRKPRFSILIPVLVAVQIGCILYCLDFF